MTTFHIEYFDPDTQKFETVEKEFTDSPAGVCPNTNFKYGAISAKEWAEDWAYSAADKRCDYKISEVKK
jgi:hypothetical protein